ncbi:MAG: DUF2138 family protein [Rhodocyclaceae bacterium]|nr:DUF2138 family protein [Rhodocyclaceae bacterium]MCA3146241.1 DUF2138 family protein [Rhodocyclaceae bacterium]
MTRAMRWIAVATALGAVVALAGAWHTGWAQYAGVTVPTSANLGRPDALLLTRSVATLPRDALKLPLARELLTEDFLFYYQSHPDVLGIEGAMRRISFERSLGWSDELVRWLLDRPAQIALWRDDKGALRHWALATERKDLGRLFEALAVVAAADGQVFSAGTIAAGDGAIALHTLALRTNRTLLLASQGDRVVVFSDPGLVLDAQRVPRGESADVLRRLLADAATPSSTPWQQSFRAGDLGSAHSLLLRASALGFGYERFFPALVATRFDFGDGAWRSQVLVDDSAPGAALVADRRSWEAVPIRPAACAQLPIHWGAADATLRAAKSLDTSQAEALAGGFDGPVLVCWYAKSGLLAPLFVASVDANRPPGDAAIAALADWALLGEPLINDEAARAGPGVRRWQHAIEVPFASANQQKRPVAGERKVTVARSGRYLLFSPDPGRVDAALEVLARRRPSLAAALPETDPLLALVTPSALSAMARDEITRMLPVGDEPVLRPVAERTLLPRVAAAGRHPAHRAVLLPAADGNGWRSLDWQALPD